MNLVFSLSHFQVSEVLLGDVKIIIFIKNSFLINETDNFILHYGQLVFLFEVLSINEKLAKTAQTI